MKHGFFVCSRELAELQYRLAELAGEGELNPNESSAMQASLVEVWQAMYSATLGAARDPQSGDHTWDDGDNCYSDGRRICTQIRIEPREQSDDNWKHNQFLLGEGAVNEYPRGTISSIAPIRTSGELVDDGRVRRRNTDFDALRKLLQQPGTGGHE